MESTTLITFMLQKTNAITVELYGSWDNFASPWEMKHDTRRGPCHWTGCHKFRNIVYDGSSSGLQPRRHGGLKMGGTYWYYYHVNGEEDHYDPSQPSTNACPLLPGQRVNVLEVPNEKSFISRSDSSSVAMITAMHTFNPDDRFRNPRPPPKPRLPRLMTKIDARHFTSWSAASIATPESALTQRVVRSATHAPTAFLSQVVDKVSTPLSALFPRPPLHTATDKMRDHQNVTQMTSFATHSHGIDKSQISYPINIPLALDKHQAVDSDAPIRSPQRQVQVEGLAFDAQSRPIDSNHRRAFTAPDLRPVTQFVHRRTVSDESVLQPSPATQRLSITRKPVPQYANFLSNIKNPVRAITADTNRQQTPTTARQNGLNLRGIEFPSDITEAWPVVDQQSQTRTVNLDKQLPALPSDLVPSPLFSRTRNLNTATAMAANPRPFVLDWARDQQKLQQSRFSVWSAASEEEEQDDDINDVLEADEGQKDSDREADAEAVTAVDAIQDNDSASSPSGSSVSLTFSEADESPQSSPIRLSDPFWSPEVSNSSSTTSKFEALLLERQQQQCPDNDSVLIHDTDSSEQVCEQDCCSETMSPIEKLTRDFQYIGPALI